MCKIQDLSQSRFPRKQTLIQGFACRKFNAEGSLLEREGSQKPALGGSEGARQDWAEEGVESQCSCNKGLSPFHREFLGWGNTSELNYFKASVYMFYIF